MEENIKRCRGARFFLCLMSASFILFSFHEAAGETSQVRELLIEAAVSPSYKAIPEWKDKFTKRLAYTSKIFEREFKIKLRPVTFADWATADEADMNSLFEDLRSKFPLAQADIVIGLTAVKKLSGGMKDLEVIGRTRPFSGYIVLREPMEPLYKVQQETVLAHELGHLFGAPHVNDQNSIMAPMVAKQIPTAFDPISREIVSAARGIDFKKGDQALDQKTTQALLAAYLKLVHEGQPFDFYFTLGSFYVKLGQGKDALQVWEKAAKLDEDHVLLRYNMGVLSLKLGLRDKAISHLNRAVTLANRPVYSAYKAQALHMLGNAHFEKGDLPAAYRSWMEAATLEPNNLDTRVNLGVVQLKQGRHKEAIEALEKAVKLGSNNATVFGSLGSAYYAIGDYQKAIHYYTRALQTPVGANTGVLSGLDSVGQPQLYIQLGLAYWKLNDSANAAANFERACRLDPSPDCRSNLVRLYFELKRWDDCIREGSAIISRRPKDASLYGMIGASFMQKGDYTNAIKVFQDGVKYVQDRPSQSLFHTHLGNLYLLTNQPDEALRQFQYSIDKNWNNADSHAGLAISYLRKNQVENARQSLRHALTINPQHADARKIQAQLEANVKR